MTHLVRTMSLLLILCGHPSAKALEPVTAQLSASWAWTGEPITLTIKLASPGPFSGTAAFDLPELPRTVMLKTGTPVLGSETLDETEWITQTHDFRVFTQQVGHVQIPPIPVRFEARQGYVGDPIPYEVTTEPLSFESRRPESADPSQVLLAANAIKTEQSWQPSEPQTIVVGEVIQRTVAREARGTTAMLMVPMINTAPEGVRVFESTPVVEDQVERGAMVARRVDRVRYQFETPGVVELPAFEFRWWDLNQLEERVERCEGLTVSVTGALGTPTEPAAGASSWLLPTGLGLVLLGTTFACYGWLRRKRTTRSREAITARQVLAACRAGDAVTTHAKTLAWRRTIEQIDTPTRAAFDQEWRRLDASLYGGSAARNDGSFSRYAHAFKAYRKTLRRHAAPARDGLPPLNPTLA